MVLSPSSYNGVGISSPVIRGRVSMGTSPEFENFYQLQQIAPKNELSKMFEALQQPLPLVIRCSHRAPLSEHALNRLAELIGDDMSEKRQLHWAGKGVWQLRLHQHHRRREDGYQRFLQRQQVRGALQRQEAVSMIPALVLAPEAHHFVLDMCASPGSKSCQLLEMMCSQRASALLARGLLVANDASLDRAISLNHRLQSTNVASPM